MVITNEINTLWPTVTHPAQGVMATRPTTAPMAAPMAEGLRPRRASNATHVTIAVAAAVLVLRNADTATPSAASELPPLNPNQPSQSNAAPRSTNGTLAGLAASCEGVRRPRNIAPARAAIPEAACTTMPPAKSWTCIVANSPSGCQVQWASGQYTITTHSTMNRRYPEKWTRSANEPVISDGVMMANFIWNRAKRASGIVVVAMPICDSSGDVGSVTLSTPTLSNMKKSHGLPITWPISLPKARPKPNTTHITLTKPITIKL